METISFPMCINPADAERWHPIFSIKNLLENPDHRLSQSRHGRRHLVLRGAAVNQLLQCRRRVHDRAVLGAGGIQRRQLFLRRGDQPRRVLRLAVRQCRSFALGSAAVQQAGSDYNVSVIANYCYDLAKEFNGFYHDYQILKEPNEQKRAVRLALCEAVAKVIKSGMGLLGIEVPERM